LNDKILAVLKEVLRERLWRRDLPLDGHILIFVDRITVVEQVSQLIEEMLKNLGIEGY
jgi:hypothetical protein